jgi:hypothetical protein
MLKNEQAKKKKGGGINTNETEIGERDTLKMDGKQKENREGKLRKLK